MRSYTVNIAYICLFVCACYESKRDKDTRKHEDIVEFRYMIAAKTAKTNSFQHNGTVKT